MIKTIQEAVYYISAFLGGMVVLAVVLHALLEMLVVLIVDQTENMREYSLIYRDSLNVGMAVACCLLCLAFPTTNNILGAIVICLFIMV